MPVTGYESQKLVEESFNELKKLILEMKTGKIYDLIGRLQVRSNCNRNKAEERVFAAISEDWIDVHNDAQNLDADDVARALKNHKSTPYFESHQTKKGPQDTEKRFDVESGKHVLMPEEEPPEEALSLTEYAKKLADPDFVSRLIREAK